MTSTSAINSEHAFKARFEDSGLLHLHERLVKRGWKTFGDLAYATSYIPGTPMDDAAFRRDVLAHVLQDTDKPEDNIEGWVRRIHFEAYIMAAAAMKASVERRGDEPPPKLDAYERDDRRAQFLERNKRGERYWRKERVPSDDLIDEFVAMYEERRIEYVPWECRTTQEFMLENKPRPSKRKLMPGFSISDTGAMSFYEKDVPPTEALLESDRDFTHKWERMMERTGMAVEIANIMSFHVHEDLREFLHDAKERRVASPEFRPVTWQQIRTAEQEVWKQLGEQLGKMRKRPGEAPPADALLEKILQSHAITQILANAQFVRGGKGGGGKEAKGGGKGSTQQQQQTETGATKSKSARRRAKKAAEKEEAEQASAATSRKRQLEAEAGRARAKAKAKASPKPGGKGAGKEPRMPAALKGHKHFWPGKGPICYAFNLPEGCSKAADGEKCPRGWHVCAAADCTFLPHSYQTCPHGGAR